MSEAMEAPVASSEVSDSTESVEQASPETTDVESELSVSESSEEGSVEVEAPQLYDIVVDGETVQVPLEDLLKGYQLKSASNKRFQEAAEARKQAELLEQQAQLFKEQILKNPYEALINSGLPVEAIRKHYEDVVYQMLKMDEMSDEERAALQREKENERIRREYEELQKKLAAKEEEDKQRSFEAQVAQQQEHWAEQIMGAIEKGGLPATPEAISHVASTLANAANNGYDLDIATAVSIYKEETDTSLKGLLSKMSEDALMSLIGEERMRVIRKKDIEAIRNPSLPSKPFVDKLTPDGEAEAASDFFDRLRQSTYRR